MERRCREFPLRRKGQCRRQFVFIGRTVSISKCDCCLIIVAGCAYKRADYIVHGDFFIYKRNHFAYLHRSVGKRTRFVQTQNVYSRKHLYAVQVLNERILFCQSDYAYRQSKRSEQKHSGRNHTDYRSGRTHNRSLYILHHGEGIIASNQTAHYHQYGKRYDKYRNHFNKKHYGVFKFAFRFLILLCPGSQGLHIVL